MYYLFDLSQKNTITLALFDENSMHAKEFEGRNRELLFCVHELLSEQAMNKEDVHGIMVVVGAGGFTSTRLAVTVANTFGYVLQIPLLAISEEQAKDPQSLISTLLEQPAGQYISATYSGAPNITVRQPEESKGGEAQRI